MKTIRFGLLVSAIAVLAGCHQGSPGGPGAVDLNQKKPPIGEAIDTFELSVPMLPTTLKQGEHIASSVGIKRGNNFDEDVKLKFDDLPTGVKITPSPALIKHGDAEAKISIEAGNNASLGNFTIKVTGHPTKGRDAFVNFAITVNKK